MTHKLPSSLTEEELLALLETAEEAPENAIFTYTDDIVPFLSNYDIQPGTTSVSKKLLYDLYKLYSEEPVSNYEFQLKVGKYLDHDRAYYKINKDQFIISSVIFSEKKTKDKTKSLSYQKHFQWFLDNKGVKSGNKWLEGFALFEIYTQFCRERRVHPKLGYKTFHKFLKLHFSYRRVNENRSLWFHVDEKTFNLLTVEQRNAISESRKKREGE